MIQLQKNGITACRLSRQYINVLPQSKNNDISPKVATLNGYKIRKLRGLILSEFYRTWLFRITKITRDSHNY